METKAACYDIDGTLAVRMLFVPLVGSEHAGGLITNRSYEEIKGLLGAYKDGQLDYETAVQLLLEAHAIGLKDRTYSVVEAHAHEFVAQNKHLFRQFGKQVVALLKPNLQQLVVTAEPEYIATAVVEYYGMDSALATSYELRAGRFTGQIGNSLADRHAKAAALADYSVRYAFGDSDGDIEMLRAARHAYCISPTDSLRSVAQASGWDVYEGDDSKIVEDVRVTLSS